MSYYGAASVIAVFIFMSSYIYDWRWFYFINHISFFKRYVLYLRDCFDNHDIFYPDNV